MSWCEKTLMNQLHGETVKFKRKQAFVARVIKKQNFVNDSPRSSGNQGKYIKKVSFPCLLLEATLSIFNFSFSLKNYFL
jgi:hypothetical protein